MNEYTIEFLDGTQQVIRADYIEVSEHGTIRFFENELVPSSIFGAYFTRCVLVFVVKESLVSFVKKGNAVVRYDVSETIKENFMALYRHEEQRQ